MNFEDDGVFIEIDDLTNCLFYIPTNTEVETTYEQNNGYFDCWGKNIDIFPEEYHDYMDVDYPLEEDYLVWQYLPRIDWYEIFDKGHDIFELFAENSDDPQGRIAINWHSSPPTVENAEAAPWNSAYWIETYAPELIEKKYLGVGGHLFAIAVAESYNRDLDGSLIFTAANLELAKHYQKTLGATIIRGLLMFLPVEAARKLYNIYFEDDDYVE